MTRLTSVFALAVIAALATGGCALESRYVTDDYAEVPEPVAKDEIAHRVILVGDAGDAEPGDPVLAEMKRVADELGGARTTIIFLGDNIYPDGMPPKEKQSYDNARLRLEAQIDPAIASGAVTVFVPGNHDHRAGGERAVIRQSKYIEDYSGGAADALPGGACPGPIVRDVEDRLRIIYLDSEWLNRGIRLHPCAQDDPDAEIDATRDVYAALSDALGGADGRLVLIASHHPLTTYGIHGGFYPWQTHLFPLWNVHEFRGTPVPYVFPIPILPSLLYVVPRRAGLYTKDDLAHGNYQDMIAAFDAVLRRHPEVEVLVAGGHEHNLQILKHQVSDDHFVLQVLSGSGTIYPPTPVGAAENTLMASPHSGFIVIDVLKRDAPDGMPIAQIEVIEVEQPPRWNTGEAPALPTIHRDFRMWRPVQRTSEQGAKSP